MTLDNINQIEYTKAPIQKEKSWFNRTKEVLMIWLVAMIWFITSMAIMNFGVINAYYQIWFDDSSHAVPQNIIADQKDVKVDVENNIRTDDAISASNNWLLKQKKDKIWFVFNQLPPDNRLFVEWLDIQAPIVDVKYYTEEKLEKWDFANELEQWVVKYPGTPNPDQKGNMLIFGHTSNYAWIKSDFNNVFSKIPQMEIGNQIKLARNGKIYMYKVISKDIVKPKDLIAIWAKNDDHYISLIWCYPIWDSKQRVVVQGKLEEVKSNQLAYNK
jgi:LPXTG-site transpeptidase (sortase) family protein